MLIVDTALGARAEQGNPIRVGILGAGFMCQGVANRIINTTPGMTVAAIYGRRVARARAVYEYSGASDVLEVTTQSALADAIRAGRPAVTEDAMLQARAEHIDVLVGTARSHEC